MANNSFKRVKKNRAIWSRVLSLLIALAIIASVGAIAHEYMSDGYAFDSYLYDTYDSIGDAPESSSDEEWYFEEEWDEEWYDEMYIGYAPYTPPYDEDNSTPYDDYQVYDEDYTPEEFVPWYSYPTSFVGISGACPPSDDIYELYSYGYTNDNYPYETTPYGGYISIQPLIIGADFFVNSTAGLQSAIAMSPPGSPRIIAITDSFTLTATIWIQSGQIITIGTMDTSNLITGAHPFGTRHTIFAPPQTSAMIYPRHFEIRNGSSLTLVNITLDGGSPAAGFNRGGVGLESGGRLTLNGRARITGCRVATLLPAGGYQGAGVNVIGHNTRVDMNIGSEIVGNFGVIGGGVGVSNHGRFYMHGGSIADNTASGFGGGVITAFFVGLDPAVHGGHFIMHNGNVSNNTSHIHGGGISADAGTVTINGGVIGGDSPALGNNAPNGSGGGVVVNNDLVQFILNGGLIDHNNALVSGGGVQMGAGSVMTMNAGIIQNNTASQGAGILFSGGTQGVFQGPGTKAIRGNTSNSTTFSAGGGILNMGGNLSINGSVYIYNNHLSSAGNGAGILQTSGTTNIGNIGGPINIVEHSSVNGAAIHVGGGTMNMYSPVNIANNTTTNANTPGGVHVNGATAVFNMRGGSIQFNGGTQGGGVRVANGIFNMDGIAAIRSINNNTATVSGGGVHITGANSQFNMNATVGSSTIRSNQVTGTGTTNGGGGVFVAGGNFRMENVGISLVESNLVASAAVGAGIHQTGGTVTMSGPNTHIRNHTSDGTATGAANNGAGVVMTGGTFNMTNGFITSNRTTGPSRAGGVNLAPGGATVATFNMYNGIIGGPGNMWNEGTNGGGVRVAGTNGAFNMQGITGTRTISHNRVYGSFASNVGAGVHVADGSFTMQGAGASIIEANLLMSNATGGAGIHQSGGTVTISSSNATIRNHNAEGTNAGLTPNNGSAVTMTSGTFNMYAGSISNNHTAAANTPGGVHVNGLAATFNMRGGIIIQNTGTQGGGVRVGSGAFNMEGAANVSRAIQNNAASASGGGVHIAGVNAQFNMRSTAGYSRISGNIVTGADPANGGGGVFLASGNFRMEGVGTYIVASNWVTNPAVGAGVHQTGGIVTMSGASSSIVNHTAEGTPAGAPSNGSGVDIRGGTFNMSAGHISNNRTAAANRPGGVNVEGTGIFNLSGGLIGGLGANNSGTAGGGVRLSGTTASFTMSNAAVISHNQATASDGTGGGVHVNNSIFVMTGGSIVSNTAIRGGGIHAASGTLNLSGAGAKSIQGNIAQADGGGVWIASTATISAQNTAFTSNSANLTNGMGGAIFTENHQYATPLTIVGAYSNIQILAGTTFSGNQAYDDHLPPTNAAAFTLIPGGSQSIHNHPINNFDINFRRDIIFVDFEFVKTDNIVTPQLGTRLQGAVFQLYRRPDAATAWAAVGAQVTSDVNGVVSLTVSPSGQYRLVEVVPPLGYAPVFGYWIIVVTEVSGEHMVTAVNNHDSSPPFVLHNGTWWVGNRLDFELPLTGGVGQSRIWFYSFGAAMLLGVGAMIGYKKLKLTIRF